MTAEEYQEAQMIFDMLRLTIAQGLRDERDPQHYEKELWIRIFTQRMEAAPDNFARAELGATEAVRLFRQRFPTNGEC